MLWLNVPVPVHLCFFEECPCTSIGSLLFSLFWSETNWLMEGHTRQQTKGNLTWKLIWRSLPQFGLFELKESEKQKSTSFIFLFIQSYQQARPGHNSEHVSRICRAKRETGQRSEVMDCRLPLEAIWSGLAYNKSRNPGSGYSYSGFSVLTGMFQGLTFATFWLTLTCCAV